MKVLVSCLAVTLFLGFGCASTDHPSVSSLPAPLDTSPRRIVFISDLHFGPAGARSDAFSPLDDFRWPRALRSFLREMSIRGDSKTDLVILGDLLELWQHPDTPCASDKPGYGCSTPELITVVDRVLEKHLPDLQALWEFAVDGRRLIIVPGNHDAALLVSKVWEHIARRVNRPSSVVELVSSGVWVSNDRQVLAEHGHQIGANESRFWVWPPVMKASRAGGSPLMEKPVGELLVEKFFDPIEAEYPVIDNIIPQSRGLALGVKAKGLQSAREIGQVLATVVFQTSLKQKIILNAPVDDNSANHGWSLEKARSLEYRLIAYSLPPDDVFRKGLLQDPAGQDAWAEMRSGASFEVSRLTDEQLVALCDLLAASRKEDPEGVPADVTCQDSLVGMALTSLIPETTIWKTHIHERNKEYNLPNGVGVFVFGHTHRLAPPLNLDVDGRYVEVVNTGAFQRLVDKDLLTALSGAAKVTELAVPLEALPPCYSFVQVDYDGRNPKPELKNWRFDEKDTRGEVLEWCDRRCARLAAKRDDIALPASCQ